MNLNGVMGVGVDVGGTHVVVDAGLHALGSFADPGRARADVVERGSVVRLAGPVANRHSTGQPAEHTETITGPMTLILINDQAEWDVCRCSVRGPVSRRVSESVSGRAEAPRIAGWSLVAGVGRRLAECGLLLLFDWFGSPAWSSIDRWFGLPDRAVWSSPGGDTACAHGELPAAFVDQVVMLVT